MKRVDYIINSKIVFFDKYYICFLMGRINEYKRLTFLGFKEKLNGVVIKRKDTVDWTDEAKPKSEKLIISIYKNHKEELIGLIIESLKKQFDDGLYINKKETVLDFLSNCK